MFCMLYMVISLKSKVRRLETSRLALAIAKLERKRLLCGDDPRHAVGAAHVFDRAIALGEAEDGTFRLKRRRSRRNSRDHRKEEQNIAIQHASIPLTGASISNSGRKRIKCQFVLRQEKS